MAEELAQKRKKLRYVPGMISALTVPLLFTFYGLKNLSEIPHYHATEVNWYDESFHPAYGKMWKTPARQYLTLNLTGNRDSDALRIQFGELYIREIYEKKDTVNGVKFILSTTSKYCELVAILDIANINNIRFYAPSDHGTLMYYVPHHPKKLLEPELMPL